MILAVGYFLYTGEDELCEIQYHEQEKSIRK